VRPAGGCARLAHQLRLAEAGRSLDQEQRSVATARAIESITQG
jgi:hypothetical protein